MTKMLNTIAVALALVAVTGRCVSHCWSARQPERRSLPQPLLGQVSAQPWEPPANRSRMTSGAL